VYKTNKVTRLQRYGLSYEVWRVGAC